MNSLNGCFSSLNLLVQLLKEWFGQVEIELSTLQEHWNLCQVVLFCLEFGKNVAKLDQLFAYQRLEI